MIICGDALTELKKLPSESVHCCITSPPYWGLRDYGTGKWEGGDPGCDHIETHNLKRDTSGGLKPTSPTAIGPLGTRGDQPSTSSSTIQYRKICGKCGSHRIDIQLGLEPTPELYVQHLVEVFREVKRILQPDGVLFLNLGDSFSSLTSSENMYILREDLTSEELYEVALGIQRDLPDLWRSCWQKKSKGSLPEMLSEGIQEKASFQNAGTATSLLSSESKGIQRTYQESKSSKTDGNDRNVGRKMRLLRGNGEDIPLPRPHQGGRSKRIQKDRRSKWGMEESNRRRITEGQISSAVLELQCGIRIVRFLSSLKIDGPHLSPSLKIYFKKITPTLKPKDLVGIPWRVALALQADGWYLRSDIIWAKPNPMPESVRDRPTRSHEYIFLLAKSARYYFDQEAVKEKAAQPERYNNRLRNPASDVARLRAGKKAGVINLRTLEKHRQKFLKNPSRNIRSVWTIGQEPEYLYGELIKRINDFKDAHPGIDSGWLDDLIADCYLHKSVQSVWTITTKPYKEVHFATFPPELPERCIKAGCPIGGVVLDPFFGAGTVGMVAKQLGREFIGIDLKPEYCEMAERRISGVAYQMPLAAGNGEEEVPL